MTEDDHLRLLGVLNSSTIVLAQTELLQQGQWRIGGGIASEDWERFYEFTGTAVQEFPSTPTTPLDRAAVLGM